MFEILLHSFVDVITNSSTTIYVIQGNRTVNTAKELLSEILKLIQYPGKLEDTFGVDVWLSNGSYVSRWNNIMPEGMTIEAFMELKRNVTLGLEEKPPWVLQTEGQYEQNSWYINIVPKAQRFIPLAEKIISFINSPYYEEGYDG